MTNLIKRRGETIATVADDYAVVAWLVNQIDDGEAIGGVVYLLTRAERAAVPTLGPRTEPG